MSGTVGGIESPAQVANVAAREGPAGNRLRPDTTTLASLSPLHSSSISDPEVHLRISCYSSLCSQGSGQQSLERIVVAAI